MYKVNDESFESFLKAVTFAKSTDWDVIEVATGARRWTPAPKVSSSRKAKYENQKNAHAAYLRSVA